MTKAQKPYLIESFEFLRERGNISSKKLKRGSGASDGGAVLILSLWVLVIVSLLVSGLAFRSGIDMRLAGIKLARARAEEISRAALRVGAAQAISDMLNEKDKSNYAAYSLAWMVNPEIYKDISIAGGGYEMAFEVKDKPDEEPSAFYGMEDEQARININAVASLKDKSLAKKILKAVLGPDVDEELKTMISGAIIDWADPSEEDGGLSEITGGGAEDSFYEGEKFPYEARDAYFEMPEELLLVRGMTREIFDKIEPVITVYGTGAVNINTAPRDVLLALGNLGEEFVDRILEYRAGDDGKWGTADDGVFTNVDAIENALGYPSGSIAALDDVRRVFEVSTDMRDLGVKEVRLLGVSSDVFRLNIIAGVQGSPLLKYVTCVIRRIADHKERVKYPEFYRVHYWNEN